MVLNSAAHIITRSLSIDQISPVLQKLHLLPLILRFCFSPLRPFISLLLCIFLNSFIYIHTLPHPQSHPTHYSVSQLYYRVVFRALSHKTFIHSIDSLDLEILSQNAPYQNGIHLWFWLYRLHSHWAFLLIILYLIIIFFVLDLVICPWVLWKVPINKMSYLLSWFRESIVCLSLFISRVRVRESDFKWCFLDPLLISWRRGFLLVAGELNWAEVISLLEILCWFNQEESLLWTDLRNWTLQQTDFYLFLLLLNRCRRIFFVELCNLYFCWILFELAELQHTKIHQEKIELL